MKSADHKRQLIAQGALYRAETVLARESLRTGLRPQVLATEALPGLAGAALTAWLGGGLATGLLGKLPVLLPLTLRVASLFAGRQGGRKRALRLAAIAAAAGGAYLYLKRKSD